MQLALRLCGGLAVMAAIAAAPSPAAAQLAVEQLVATLPPVDGVASIVIPVRNDGDLAIDVDIVINDWIVDETGAHRFAPAGTLAGSCAGRLRADEQALRIEPRGTAQLRVAYEGDADDRCRNIVFFRVSEGAVGPEGDQLIISTGVKVYVER